MPRHLSSVVAACCVGVLLSAAAVAGAQQEIASSPIGPDGQYAHVVLPLVDAYDGVTVATEREHTPSGQRRYFLTAYRDGQRTRLPVAPRGLPFDVDLGPDGRGGVVAAYSRCAPERRDRIRPSRVFSAPQPRHTLGRGCDLYRFDFATARESKIAGASTDQASEMLPSIWNDRIAFTRVYEQRGGDRGTYPYLYTRPLTGGPSQREPGGSRGTNGLPGPTALDLYGQRLSFVWNYSTGEARSGDVAGVSEVRLNTVGGGHQVLSQARFENLEYASYVTPQGADGRIYYGFQRVRSRGERPPTSLTTLMLRYHIATGDRATAQPPSQLLSSAVDGDALVFGVADDFISYGGGGRILRHPRALPLTMQRARPRVRSGLNEPSAARLVSQAGRPPDSRRRTPRAR